MTDQEWLILQGKLQGSACCQMDVDSLRAYFEGLYDLPTWAIGAGLTVYFATTARRGLPTISEIRAAATEQMFGRYPTAGEAWKEVRQVARGQRKKSELSPMAFEALERTCTIEAINARGVDKIGVIESQFRSNYNELANEGRRLRSLPPGHVPTISTDTPGTIRQKRMEQGDAAFLASSQAATNQLLGRFGLPAEVLKGLPGGGPTTPTEGMTDGQESSNPQTGGQETD